MKILASAVDLKRPHTGLIWTAKGHTQWSNRSTQRPRVKSHPLVPLARGPLSTNPIRASATDQGLATRATHGPDKTHALLSPGNRVTETGLTVDLASTT